MSANPDAVQIYYTHGVGLLVRWIQTQYKAILYDDDDKTMATVGRVNIDIGGLSNRTRWLLEEEGPMIMRILLIRF